MARSRKDVNLLPVVQGSGVRGEGSSATHFLVHPEDESAEAILRAAVEVPKVIGVYCLVVGEQIVYVGVSSDVLRRLFEHKRKGRFENRPSKFERVAVFHCRTREEADRLETKLIRELQPPWNGTGLERDREPAWWKLAEYNPEDIAKRL